MSTPSPSPALSVIIPAFNRVTPLRHTLRSALRASAALPTEIIVVDDGSSPPLADQLAGFDSPPHRFVRQVNQGSIVARLTGLAAAAGEFVLFLDSDDLVAPNKFIAQVDALRREQADACYGDMAIARPAADGDWEFSPADRLENVADSADLYLRLQPAPHNIVYRREYLRRALARPIVPTGRPFDPAGDVWLFYNLAIHTARVCKVDLPLTAVGPHDEARYSRCWEQLAVAALLIMREFAARCPRSSETEHARRIAGEIAFASWRRMPRKMPAGFEEATLALWRSAPRGPLSRLGEKRFPWLAAMLGAERAGRWLRAARNTPFKACRTVSAQDYERLFVRNGFGS